MKRGLLFFVFIAIFFIAISLVESTITGKSITGNATSSFGVGITIIDSPPLLTITNPVDGEIYLKRNLSVNYSVSGEQQLNYSIGSGSNITITEQQYINFNSGSNTLHLWANSTGGLNHSSVTFTVNLTLLQINYTDFNSSNKGSSTDFYEYSYSNLTNLSGIIFENTATNGGKIYFSGAINVTNDSDNTDGIVNLSDNIDISSNSVTINSTALPNFNTSARIYLYNLTLTDPRVLADGAVCPSTRCSEINYSGGTFVFTVTQFTTYSVEETPSTTQTPSGGGGGGGGGGGSAVYKLDIIVPKIWELGRNDSAVVPITIRNPEKITFREIKMTTNSSTKELDAIFEDITIKDLQPGQNKTIMLFLESTNLLPGDYEIELRGNVKGPTFIEKKTMYIKGVEVVGKAEVTERILLAQGLFKENPECLELNDLLIQAQSLTESGDIENAKKIVQDAISKCRDLITNKEFPSGFDYGSLSAWRTPLEVALILIVVTLIIFMVLRRPKIDLKEDK